MAIRSAATIGMVVVSILCLGLAYGVIGFSGIAGCRLYAYRLGDLSLFNFLPTFGGVQVPPSDLDIVVLPYAAGAFWLSIVILCALVAWKLIRRQFRPVLYLAGLVVLAIGVAQLQANRVAGFHVPCEQTQSRPA